MYHEPGRGRGLPPPWSGVTGCIRASDASYQLCYTLHMIFPDRVQRPPGRSIPPFIGLRQRWEEGVDSPIDSKKDMSARPPVEFHAKISTRIDCLLIMHDQLLLFNR